MKSTWFEQKIKLYPELAILKTRPIAYFCFEYGIEAKLPIYSGGLGVLAGDFLKEANDRGLPLVAVGLFYKESYFTQTVTETGQQTEFYQLIDPDRAGLMLVRDQSGNGVTVTIHLIDRSITLAIWRYQVGSIALYLLDSDVAANQPADRVLTSRLYSGDPSTRLLQEVILGLGGQKALTVLGIHPTIYHMNEGHSAFLVVGLVHHYVLKHQLSLEKALARAKSKVVFTNHTLVPAGNDRFDFDFVKADIALCDDRQCLPIDRILGLGAVRDEPGKFGVTELALRIASRVNAVSVAHAEHARELWPETDFIPITNGVHPPTHALPELVGRLRNQPEAVARIPDHELWALHQGAKARLAQRVYQLTGVTLTKETLIITWARRFAAYKQPLLMLSDISRLKALIERLNGKLALLIAGKAHPDDAGGKEIIEEIHHRIREHDLEQYVIFLPDYSLDLASELVRGSDVWLNTPAHAHEACGTSGMKAGLNGVLNLSTPGGWVREVEETELGWLLPETKTGEALYDRLEQQIIPLYTLRQDHLPHAWIARMKQVMRKIWTDYTTDRMLDQYLNELYRPVIRDQTTGRY